MSARLSGCGSWSRAAASWVMVNSGVTRRPFIDSRARSSCRSAVSTPASPSGSSGSSTSAGTPRTVATAAATWPIDTPSCGRDVTVSRVRSAYRRSADSVRADQTNSHGPAGAVVRWTGAGGSSMRTCALAPPAPNALSPARRGPPDGRCHRCRSRCTRKREPSRFRCGFSSAECRDGASSPWRSCSSTLVEAGDAGGAFQMADVRLDRADGTAWIADVSAVARPVPVRPALEGLAQALHFDRIAERGAGAVRLDVSDRFRLPAGLRQRAADHRCLRGRVRDGETAGPAAVIHRGGRDHPVDVIAVGERPMQRLEEHRPDALARHVARRRPCRSCGTGRQPTGTVPARAAGTSAGARSR